MSRWARWAIGIATLLGGAAILLPQPRPGPIASAIAVVVIALVIVACFSKFGGPAAARILGATISFAYFCYFLIAINPYYSRKFGLSGPDHWEWRTAAVAFLGTLRSMEHWACMQCSLVSSRHGGAGSQRRRRMMTAEKPVDEKPTYQDLGMPFQPRLQSDTFLISRNKSIPTGVEMNEGSNDYGNGSGRKKGRSCGFNECRAAD
jgi:hypothetical protein